MDMSSNDFAKTAFTKPASENMIDVKTTTKTTNSGLEISMSTKNSATMVTIKPVIMPLLTPPAT